MAIVLTLNFLLHLVIDANAGIAIIDSNHIITDGDSLTVHFGRGAEAQGLMQPLIIMELKISA